MHNPRGNNNLKPKAHSGVAYQEDSECPWVAEIQFWLKSTWIIYGKTWKWLSSNDQQPIWQSLIYLIFLKHNGQMLHNPSVEGFLETYPERLTAVIAAKDASTKYWLGGVNTCINKIFLRFIFNKLANIFYKHVFTSSLWGVVCRWVRKNKQFNQFWIQAVTQQNME